MDPEDLVKKPERVAWCPEVWRLPGPLSFECETSQVPLFGPFKDSRGLCLEEAKGP